MVVTRVQVAERWVRAAGEKDAATKVQAEFDRPYGAPRRDRQTARSCTMMTSSRLWTSV